MWWTWERGWVRRARGAPCSLSAHALLGEGTTVRPRLSSLRGRWQTGRAEPAQGQPLPSPTSGSTGPSARRALPHLIYWRDLMPLRLPPAPRPPQPLFSSVPGTLELHIPFSQNAPHSVCLLPPPPPPPLTLANQLLKGRCPGHKPRNKRTSGRAQSPGQVLSAWLRDARALPGPGPSGPSASAPWPSCRPASALAPPLPPLLQSLRKPTTPHPPAFSPTLITPRDAKGKGQEILRLTHRPGFQTSCASQLCNFHQVSGPF